MTTHRRLSTLHLLGMFAFTALALNDDHFVLGVGSFKLSPFDFLFVAMLVVKMLRLADPAAYALPRGMLGMLLGIQCVSVIYLLLVSLHHPGIETGDVARDLRIVFYFLCTPFLCYKDIDSPAAYAVLQKYIVAACLAVATLMLAEQLQGFSVANPLRNVRLGVWAIPFGVVSLLYFRRTLNVSGPKAYALTVYMLLALVFSLNRSQYLQLAISVFIPRSGAAPCWSLRRRQSPGCWSSPRSATWTCSPIASSASSAWTRTPATARASRKCRGKWTSSRRVRCSARARAFAAGSWARTASS
jgi:hypothetical protein